MMDDYKVKPRSTKNIEEVALAWRDALDVTNEWAPDVVRLVESQVPRLIPTFSLIVRADLDMGDAEAYTEFDPPHIAVRESVYYLAKRRDGRSRMTFAHELGHLVMHPGIAKLRREYAKIVHEIKPYESAEWQAKKFGSLFLMPGHIVVEFTSASQMAECCQVSLQAAEIRFGEINHNKPKAIAACVRDAVTDLSK
jgi:Zn-dependent peptidase ImmA (M78 family)